MSFRLVAFALLAAMCLQSAVVFGPATVAQRAGDIEHLMVHGQDVEHHHHSDSSLHMDDGGAVQHSHPDHSSGFAALINAHNSALLNGGSSSLAEAQTTLWISATADGLLRPPTQHA
jgi:hypothetical protein